MRLDVFSFGKLLWEMLTEKVPYADPRDSLEWWAASEWNRPSLEHDTRITRLRRGSQMRGLISRCWREPEARPAAGEIVRDLEKILEKTPLETLWPGTSPPSAFPTIIEALHPVPFPSRNQGSYLFSPFQFGFLLCLFFSCGCSCTPGGRSSREQSDCCAEALGVCSNFSCTSFHRTQHTLRLKTLQSITKWCCVTSPPYTPVLSSSAVRRLGGRVRRRVVLALCEAASTTSSSSSSSSLLCLSFLTSVLVMP